MRRMLLVVLCTLAMAGCAVKNEIPRSEETVRQAVYRHGGQPALTLFTMKSNSTGAGAHSSLMINGSQRVIFDPAGSFRNEAIIRKDDVVYGVTDSLLDVYTRYHARESYHVQVQRLPVSAGQAEAVMRVAMSMGQQADARCAASIAEILGQFPQFDISSTWFPNNLAEQFGQLPAVTSRELYEYDSDDNSAVLATFDPDRVKAQRRARSAAEQE
jgi:hypothetical protein